MASTKGINTKYDDRKIESLYYGIMSRKKEMEADIAIYEKQSGKDFPLKIVEKKENDYDYINPQHYVQDDGKQTWERMVDKFGLEQTAVFCELNAFKYQERIGKKPNEDIQREQDKIDWYNNKAKELRQKLNEEKRNKFF